MSLVADYESDSDESKISDENEQIVVKTEIKTELTSESEEEEIKQEKTLITTSFKLPTPKFTKAPTDTNSSVFINPFLEAENAKEAILQKHVKMVNTKDAIIINGKKICWNYRKGRCRFGHNCKYAHDSDLQKTKEELDSELKQARAQSVICQFDGTNHLINKQTYTPEDVVEKEKNKKRKRPGLTQGLVPGKKVMKQCLGLSNKS